ncbi:hypothetical protein BU16DRAFT_108915 [Lophium mytilinum]|uniref:Uncharacterized protein n=1 Tax=Lophium mytilinum TaxID=390894 RepID=A0A6A6QKS4_9PEZI|nr:hypothetical protein BU16DRAFT_108915 [Lophium mytilinum]
MSGNQEPTMEEKMQAREAEVRALLASSPEAQQELQRLAAERIASVLGQATTTGGSSRAAATIGDSSRVVATEGGADEQQAGVQAEQQTTVHEALGAAAQAIEQQQTSGQEVLDAAAQAVRPMGNPYDLYHHVKLSTHLVDFLKSTVMILKVSEWDQLIMAPIPGHVIVLAMTSNDTCVPICVADSSLLHAKEVSGYAQGPADGPSHQHQHAESSGKGKEPAGVQSEGAVEGPAVGGPAVLQAEGAGEGAGQHANEGDAAGATTSMQPEDDGDQEGLSSQEANNE